MTRLSRFSVYQEGRNVHWLTAGKEEFLVKVGTTVVYGIKITSC